MYGFAAVQALPGPVFSFSAYIGALSMREYGTWGSILGGVVAAIGINLPGTLLIFFVITFWQSLKKYRQQQTAQVLQLSDPRQQPT